MKIRSAIVLSAILGIILVTLSGPGPARAQPSEGSAVIYEIIVTAPRQAVRETRRPLAGGAEVSMSYSVGFADLDLTRSDHRTELEERVREAAEEICELLVERYSDRRRGPERRRSTEACTSEALRDALTQVEAAVAAFSTGGSDQ